MAGPDQRVTMNDRENCQPWCTPIAHVRSISVGRTRGRSQVTQGRPMVAVSSSRTGHGSTIGVHVGTFAQRVLQLLNQIAHVIGRAE
jgi:hypothetical protein